MNLSDITKINFGSANITAVYNGGIKLWPKQVDTGNKVMKFTVVSGDTWDNTHISAYTADNRLIEPVLKDATGWTYGEDVTYLSSEYGFSYNLLTFEGFPKSVKLKSGQNLFYWNAKCTDITTTNIDVSECTNFNNMFTECKGLTVLDVSTWDTSKVSYMNNMFANCYNLSALDLSNWNTSQVSDMNNMFVDCHSLNTLDLSNWNTSNLSNVSNMFFKCYNLDTLDLSNWNTVLVTDASGMFKECTLLSTLNLSKWDTSNLTGTTDMFTECPNLRTLEMHNCSQATVDKIRAAIEAAGLLGQVEFIVDDGILLE